MSVAAVIVTRGDQLLTDILTSIPSGWSTVVWDNSRDQDMAVYGRYEAIALTDADLIYVQDDDCVVSDPAAVMEGWLRLHETRTADPEQAVVCNMPPEFRHSFYEHHALVGFGAVFHRDAPARAFRRFRDVYGPAVTPELFNRTCDIVFTGLTARVLVDVAKYDLPWAHYEDRMWKQPGHQADRLRMLDMVRAIA